MFRLYERECPYHQGRRGANGTAFRAFCPSASAVYANKKTGRCKEGLFSEWGIRPGLKARCKGGEGE